MAVRGLDVSSYQKPAEWVGILPDFVFIKASEGQHTHDPSFGAHLSAAVAQRTVTGAYHFAWPTEDVYAQVVNLSTALGTAVGSGAVRMLALDLEPYPDGRNVEGMSASQIQSWGAGWIAGVRRMYPGVKVGVYADLYHYGRGWVPANGDFYWVAEYRGGMTYSRAEKSPWPSVSYEPAMFWQFTSSPLDLDLCTLEDREHLRAWAGAPAAHPAPAAPRATYVVREGDTLSGIAQAHGVSLAVLEHLNPQIKNPDVIYAGQTLTLPPGTRRLPASTRYVVRSGDTLSGIAQAHGVSLTALERANPQVRNPNLIYAGAALVIPARS